MDGTGDEHIVPSDPLGAGGRTPAVGNGGSLPIVGAFTGSLPRARRRYRRGSAAGSNPCRWAEDDRPGRQGAADQGDAFNRQTSSGWHSPLGGPALMRWTAATAGGRPSSS